MPFEMKWIVENQVAYMQMMGDLTWEEIPQHNAAYLKHIEASSKPLVHIIAETRELKSFPLNVFKLRRMVTAFDHPRMGWFLVLTDNRIVGQIASLLASIQKQNRQRIINGSLTEAIEFLKQVDSTIEIADWSQIHQVEGLSV